MKTKTYIKSDYAVIEFNKYLSLDEKKEIERTIKEQNKQVKVVFFRHLLDNRYKTAKY